MQTHKRTERNRWWLLPFFLQQRTGKTQGRTGRLFSHPYMFIAVVAVGISVAAMLLSINVSRGFQQEISSRIVGFLGHLQLVSRDHNVSYEQHPITILPALGESFAHLDGIEHSTTFAQRPGIIKTRDDMEGGVLKGYRSVEDLAYFTHYLRRGRLPRIGQDEGTSEIFLSEYVARRLHLDTGMLVTIYFVEQPPRVRQFRLVGIYETQFEEFDKTYLFTDLKALQSESGWDSTKIGGYELRVRSLKDLNRVRDTVEELALGYIQPDGRLLRVVDVRETHVSLFDWLSLQDINVIVLFVLMLLVAGVNMISVLLILVLERMQLIGLLRALGATVEQLRLLFLLYASRILLYGLILGNILGLTLCYTQYRWHWVHLSPATYYVDYVPVELNFWTILWVNLGTIAITVLLLLLTSRIVGRRDSYELLTQD